MTTANTLPLRGCVVLDLSDEALVLAGRLLADLGADVIRVEPASGDPLRHRGPFVEGQPGPEASMAHLLYNSGKRSLALALDDPEAWDVLDRLLVGVDVVLAPLERTRLAGLFFDPQRMAAVHPALGVVEVVGRRGRPDLATTDLIACAAGGLIYCNGFPDRPPDYPAGNLAFKQASFVACATAASLCLDRNLRGTGGRVAISLQEAIASTTILASNENHWRWRQARSNRTRAAGLAYPDISAGEDLVSSIAASCTTFKAKDGGWVVFGFTPFTMDRWKSFAAWYEELTGSAELYDEKWGDPLQRVDQRTELDRAVARVCSLLPRDALAIEAQARGLMVLPIHSAADLSQDPHLTERGCFQSVMQPGVGKEIPRVRAPFRSSAFATVATPAPLLGQHSAEVLGEIAGMDVEAIEELRRRGVVVVRDAAAEASREVVGARAVQATSLRSRRTSHGSHDLPLAGYRVLDFCWMAAGPLITEILANLGADVVKVESLARMDTLREYHHPVEKATIDTAALFNDCNTGKRSITLNLATPRARELACELAAAADIVTSNFTPGQMERWSLGYEDLRRLRPDLIVGTFPVMGSTGPRSHWRGIGSGVGALSGLSWQSGHADRPPIGLGTLHPDFTLAPLAAALLIAALLERERTGQGQHVEIAQYDAAIQLVDAELTEYLVNGTEAPRRGNRSPWMVPHGVFPCRGDDRWVAIAARSTIEWQHLCRVMGRLDLANRADLATLAGRRSAEDAIEAAISAWTRDLEAAVVADRLQEAGVPASALQHTGDLLDSDPSMAGFYHSFVHPAGMDFIVQNQPFTWNGERLPIERGPLLGEHNEDVFRRELNIDEEALIQLMRDRVVY